MTRQSARRPKKVSALELYSGVAAQRAGAFISENPALVGGSTAFAVAMFFVATNALYYQPNAHRGAFFETRSLAGYKAPALAEKHSRLGVADGGREDTFRIVQDDAPQADPVVRDIQSALQDMAMYDGTVDGIAGPRTLAAIRDFQKRAGMEPNGKVGEPLLDAIRTASVPAPKLKMAAQPKPAPSEKSSKQENAIQADDLQRVQAALKKHGHGEVDADGIYGSKTSDAIKAFQTSHKMKVTGAADAALLRAMAKAGWIEG